MNQAVDDIIRNGKFKKQIEEILVEDARKRTGLARLELVVLYLLHRDSELNTLTGLAGYLQVNKGHLSTTLDSLSKKGYVLCRRDESDHRYVRYALTEEANALAVEMDEQWERLSAGIVKEIDRKELEIFHRVARHMEKNMEELLGEYGKTGKL